MSQENVEAFMRAVEAGNRRDWDALLKELDPEVEWRAAFLTSLEGEATVLRGHDEVREWFRNAREVLPEVHTEYSDIRVLGGRLIAIGRIRTRGESSGAKTQSPIAYVVDYMDGKATRVRSYLDPQEALEAVGLRE